MPALRDLHTLERVTGVSGEIDVDGPRARTSPRRASIGWMIRYENALLTHYGYLEAKGCAKATLCPALSLPDLFSSGQPGHDAGAAERRRRSTSLLAAVPGYFSQAVITPDHREATLAFGIRLMPLSRQERRDRLHALAAASAAGRHGAARRAARCSPPRPTPRCPPRRGGC